MNDDTKKIIELGIENWEKEYLTNNDEWSAVFCVKPFNQPKEERGGGFEFYSLTARGQEIFEHGKGDMEYEVIAHGSAYWDGMRHLYFGHEKTGNYGYLFWHKKAEILWTIEMISKYGEIYCREFDF
jgi:hypothetical protein